MANVGDAAVPAGVFAGIVQECADGLVFICAVLEGDARDAKKVGYPNSM